LQFICDLRFGPDDETMGSILHDLGTEFGLDKSIINGLENLSKSHMGIYRHEGIENGLVRLKEIATGEINLCFSTSKYLGSINEIWFVRTVQNLDSIYDYKIVLITPFILTESTESDWIEFYKRQSIILDKGVDGNAYLNFMKYIPNSTYWHNYIMDGFLKYEPNSIYLKGIPDVVGSKPYEVTT